MSEFAVIGGKTNSSHIGLQFSRCDDSQYAQFCVTHNVPVRLEDIPSANGGKGTVACLNIAAEIFTCYNADFQGNTGLAIFADNSVIPPKSYYSTYTAGIGIPTSCSTFELVGTAHLRSTNAVGAALWAKDVAVLRTGWTYLTAFNPADPDKALPVRSDGFAIGWDCHFFPEFAQKLGRVSNLLDCTIRFYAIYDNTRYLQLSSDPALAVGGVNPPTVSISGSQIDFKRTSFGGTAPDYWIVGSPSDGFRNNKIYATIDPGINFFMPENEQFLVFNNTLVSETISRTTVEELRTRDRGSAGPATNPLRIGANYVGFDPTGKMYTKNGSPRQGDTDGVVVGTQA